MILWLWSIILSVLLAGNVALGFAESSVQPSESLDSLVYRFLDTGEANEAERLLQTILADEKASVEVVAQIIGREGAYQRQPVEIFPREQIIVRGRAYPLSLSIPASYQTSKSYALIVCLHGYGFTGEEYLERWRARLGEGYLLACPTYPSGAWFTRHAEELVLETIREVRRQYHIIQSASHWCKAGKQRRMMHPYQPRSDPSIRHACEKDPIRIDMVLPSDLPDGFQYQLLGMPGKPRARRIGRAGQ